MTDNDNDDDDNDEEKRHVSGTLILRKRRCENLKYRLDATQWFIELIISSKCFEQHPPSRTLSPQPHTRPHDQLKTKCYVPHAVITCIASRS